MIKPPERSPSGSPLVFADPSDRLRAVIDAAPMILWMLDERGVFTFSAGKALKALGLEKGEVVGRSVFEVYAGQPTILEDNRSALAGEERASIVNIGSVWFESRCAPLWESGKVVGVIGVAVDVTERHQAESALARSLSLIRATLESTADGILVVDREGRIVTFNSKFVELWNIPDEVLASGNDESALGHVVGQLADPQSFIDRVSELYADPEAQSFDVLHFKDGRVFERFSQPQRVGSAVVGRVWSFRDVTERQQAQMELLRRESQLAHTQQLAGLGSWDWEVGSNQVAWSDEMYRIYGLEPQSLQITFEEFLSRLPPEDRIRIGDAVQRSLDTGYPFDLDHRVVRPDGSIGIVHAVGEVICDDEGKPRRMLGTGQDVTDRRAASEALRISEQRFRTIFEQFPFSLQIFSPTGETVEVNHAWTEFFGTQFENVKLFNPLTDPQLAEIAPFIRRAFAGEAVSIPATLFDPGRIPQDPANAPDTPVGSGARWVQVFMCPVKDDDGGVREVFIVHQDVTREKEAEEVLRRSNEELERAVEARTAELAETNAALEEEIADRERAEEELRMKTSELEAIFRALPDCFVKLGADGTILETRTGSQAGVCLWPAECVGLEVGDHLQGEAAVAFKGALATVRERRLARVEYVSMLHGKPRDFEARLVPLSDEETVAIIRDITVQKEAERARRKSEEHFRLLIENSSDVATILGPDGMNWYQSPSITGILGYTPQEMVGTTAFERIHPDDVAETSKSLAEVIKQPGNPVAVEFRYRHKDGSWRYLEARAKTLLPDSAEAGVIVNSRDVTDRHEAVEALQRREEHFRRLIENGTDLIQVIDPDGRFSYCSPSINRILGYAPEAVTGHRFQNLIHPDDREEIEAAWHAVVASPGMTRSAEYRIRHRDGTWRVFEGVGRTVSPLTGDEGVVVNARDVTERKGFEQALRQAIEDAEKAREGAETANRAKSEFLSRMSHELRTPLNSILGFAQVVARKDIPPDQRKATDHILKAGRHLLNLINEVLDIARIESNRQHLSLEPVQVRSAIQEAINLIQPLATERGCKLEEWVATADWYVRADRQRLTQVLLNLLSNAVKYNRPEGSVRIRCEERLDGEGAPKLRIEVSDTGHGIDPHRMGELFTPFARLGAEQTNVEGTGLGLALSQRLVQAMDGTLTARSLMGIGSTFTVELPFAHSPLAEWNARSGDANEPARAPVDQRPSTILYIEDNLANFALIETVLGARPGVTLIPALQGRIGLELAWKHAPDLILLDLHLPDLPGAEVLERLHSDPRSCDIPVIVVSADATKDSIDRLRARGAHSYLTKPIDVDGLLEVVDRTLLDRTLPEIEGQL